jgi:hypothetical protein
MQGQWVIQILLLAIAFGTKLQLEGSTWFSDDLCYKFIQPGIGAFAVMKPYQAIALPQRTIRCVESNGGSDLKLCFSFFYCELHKRF